MPGMGAPVIAPPKLITLTKPALKSAKKLKAFVWKRIIIDFEGTGEVSKKDLKGPDPAWKGKDNVWKHIKENKEITLEMVEEKYEDKVKAPVVVADPGLVDLNKPKQYFSNQQPIFIMLSRMPKAETLIQCIQRLDSKKVSEDSMNALVRNWPSDEFDGLIQEAKDSPDSNWAKSEAYFITLGGEQMILEKIKLWLFSMKFENTVAVFKDNLANLINALKVLKEHKSLHFILGSVLKIGNCLNAGNKSRGQADGFEIDALSKSFTIKDKENKSIISFISQLAIEKNEEYVNFKQDFVSVYACTKINTGDLKTNINREKGQVNQQTNFMKKCLDFDPDV